MRILVYRIGKGLWKRQIKDDLCIYIYLSFFARLKFEVEGVFFYTNVYADGIFLVFSTSCTNMAGPNNNSNTCEGRQEDQNILWCQPQKIYL